MSARISSVESNFPLLAVYEVHLAPYRPLDLILCIIKQGMLLGILGDRAGVQQVVNEKRFERFY